MKYLLGGASMQTPEIAVDQTESRDVQVNGLSKRR